MPVIDKDHGWKIIKHAFETYKGRVALCGVQGATGEKVEHDESKLTNIELATFHEFGGGGDKIRPPERSFLRSTFDENLGKYKSEHEKICKMALDPEQAKHMQSTVDGNLLLLAEKMKIDVHKKITTAPGIAPPLKPVTIEKAKHKGIHGREREGETPLFDTGKLAASISTALVAESEAAGMPR